MCQSEEIELTSKWMQEFGFIDEEEHNEIKLKDFQFKVTDRIYVTKASLHRINKVDNNNCEYCNHQPETIYHLFVECETVRRFWTELQTWLSTNKEISKLYSPFKIAETRFEIICA